MQRRQNFQTIAWFSDLKNRNLLNLEPPYQRRSVWNQEYKDFFVETILLKYPAPALFLYEEISPDGVTVYNVVDGKQRLTAIFEFIASVFPVSESTVIKDLRGKYFQDLSKEEKVNFWNYSFLIEYLPTIEESIVNNIFDRINRNVAKLTPQELRHAKFSGRFITKCEDLVDFMSLTLVENFPRINIQSRKQMKDVEFISQLILSSEEGFKGYSIEELDKAFSDRDTEWNEEYESEAIFRQAITLISLLVKSDSSIAKSRFSNQADFYSLYGALTIDVKASSVKSLDHYLNHIKLFLEAIDDEQARVEDSRLELYYQHTRVASNRTKARKERTDVLHQFISLS